jgi:hypothetical protein
MIRNPENTLRVVLNESSVSVNVIYRGALRPHPESMRSVTAMRGERFKVLDPHPEERALLARASRRMAACTAFAAILRDASLRDAPQDEDGIGTYRFRDAPSG